MAGGFPLGLDICNGNTIGVSSFQQTAITSSATANTKGSWAQVVASAPTDACFVLIDCQFSPQGSSTASMGLDIGIGASGSEVVLVSNLVLQSSYNYSPGKILVSLPLSIPKGTRIAARAQDNVGGNAAAISITLFDGSFTMMEGAAGADAIGFVSVGSAGSALTPGASSTKGTYVQLISATARDYIGFFAVFDPGYVTGQTYNYSYDVAIGASGSEQIILPDVAAGGNYAAWWTESNNIGLVPIMIPAGTRIAARVASAIGNTAPVGLTLYGLYQ